MVLARKQMARPATTEIGKAYERVLHAPRSVTPAIEKAFLARRGQMASLGKSQVNDGLHRQRVWHVVWKGTPLIEHIMEAPSDMKGLLRRQLAVMVEKILMDAEETLKKAEPDPAGWQSRDWRRLENALRNNVVQRLHWLGLPTDMIVDVLKNRFSPLSLRRVQQLIKASPYDAGMRRWRRKT